MTVVTNNGPDEPLRNYAPAGSQIYSIEEGSPAETAGLQEYDVITHVDGERIKTNEELTAIIDEHQAGDVITLTVARYYDENGNQLLNPEVLDIEVELQIID